MMPRDALPPHRNADATRRGSLGLPIFIPTSQFQGLRTRHIIQLLLLMWLAKWFIPTHLTRTDGMSVRMAYISSLTSKTLSTTKS